MIEESGTSNTLVANTKDITMSFLFKEGPVGEKGKVGRVGVTSSEEFGWVSLSSELDLLLAEEVTELTAPKRLKEELEMKR